MLVIGLNLKIEDALSALVSLIIMLGAGGNLVPIEIWRIVQAFLEGVLEPTKIVKNFSGQNDVELGSSRSINSLHDPTSHKNMLFALEQKERNEVIQLPLTLKVLWGGINYNKLKELSNNASWRRLLVNTCVDCSCFLTKKYRLFKLI